MHRNISYNAMQIVACHLQISFVPLLHGTVHVSLNHINIILLDVFHQKPFIKIWLFQSQTQEIFEKNPKVVWKMIQIAQSMLIVVLRNRQSAVEKANQKAQQFKYNIVIKQSAKFTRWCLSSWQKEKNGDDIWNCRLR